MGLLPAFQTRLLVFQTAQTVLRRKPPAIQRRTAALDTASEKPHAVKSRPIPNQKQIPPARGGICFLVRQMGLEPIRLRTRTSNVPVCQFQHCRASCIIRCSSQKVNPNFSRNKKGLYISPFDSLTAAPAGSPFFGAWRQSARRAHTRGPRPRACQDFGTSARSGALKRLSSNPRRAPARDR